MCLHTMVASRFPCDPQSSQISFARDTDFALYTLNRAARMPASGFGTSFLTRSLE